MGGLNASDRCPACRDHSVFVSSCYGCFHHSVSSQMCGVIWGNRDAICAWQFINQGRTSLGWTDVRQVSLVRTNWVCLAFSTVLFRARNRWPRFAAVCMRWTPLTQARRPRTPLGLSWPPWDSSRTPISCARSSVSSWRRSAPTWKYVFPSLPCLHPPFHPSAGWMLCVYTDADEQQSQIPVMKRILVVPKERGLDSECWDRLLWFQEAHHAHSNVLL